MFVRVFTNGPGDLGSIPGCVIPKTLKMVLDASLLNIQHYKVQIKGKVEKSGKGVAPSPTLWCSSYRKGSLRVTLDYGHQLYLQLYGILGPHNQTVENKILIEMQLVYCTATADWAWKIMISHQIQFSILWLPYIYT